MGVVPKWNRQYRYGGFLKKLISITTLVLAGFLGYFAFVKAPLEVNYQLASEANPIGFIPNDCWFTPGDDWPQVNCYQMQVPENHLKPDGRLITFPVIVFRSEVTSSRKAPLLHLGAGGPGAAMFLDLDFMVEYIWNEHDAMSLHIGRDLYLIDPRGAGLSQPLLTCNKFVDSELLRLRSNLSLEDEMVDVDRDYFHCIDDFLSQGVDLSTYNSLSIANDIEAMRIAAGLDQWVLLGVSYGTIYAQAIANQFPASVETMVLDSAVFPNVKTHHNYIERTMASYRSLYNYCEKSQACSNADETIRDRIWSLYEALTDAPIKIDIEHPYQNQIIPLVLNGERFLRALFQGMYGMAIYSDIAFIVQELESRSYQRIKPYVQDYVAYELDRTYGDVSASAHYCFEDKPFIDFELINELIPKLPKRQIRESQALAMTWSNYCNRMQINRDISEIGQLSKPTAIPTLFLHGKFDTVTPLSDVELNRSNFYSHELVTFDLAHSILTSSTCAEEIAGQFIENQYLEDSQMYCREEH